jgi:hypothetical protein
LWISLRAELKNDALGPSFPAEGMADQPHTFLLGDGDEGSVLIQLDSLTQSNR